MLRLGLTQWRHMVAHALTEAPLEACGLLLGPSHRSAHDEGITFAPVANAAASPVRYELDAHEYLTVVADAEAAGRDVVGVVHSHPSSPAFPSTVDLDRATHPLIPDDWYWVIISLVGGRPETRCFYLKDARVEAEVAIELLTDR